jgi:periplasmic divalent cation tolerance protein
VKITFFYIPCGTESEALSIGKQAVENRLAACANVFPIQSVFPWNGSIQEENEFILILKTTPSCASSLRSFISEKHGYEVPCIVSWEVEVNDAYGKWVEENTITGE